MQRGGSSSGACREVEAAARRLSGLWWGNANGHGRLTPPCPTHLWPLIYPSIPYNKDAYFTRLN